MSFAPLLWTPTKASGSAPTITSANYSVIDINGGGQAIVAQGTLLTGALSVLIGGNTVTPTSSTSTSVTFAAPAHAAGAVTMSVTTPGGTSGTLPITYWSPSSITGIDSYFDSELGVTTVSSHVSAWADQGPAGQSLAQATSGLRPIYSVSSFGTLHGVTFTAASNALPASSGVRMFSGGLSVFAVMKTTDARSGAGGSGYVGDAPNNILGDTTGSVVMGFGTSAATAQYEAYAGVPGWSSTGGGANVNDGNAHMIGATQSTAGAGPINVYKGATSVASGASTPYVSVPEWNVVGGGFSSTDAFGGVLGALVTVQGLISTGATSDLANLWAWAQQRFGAV